MKLRTISALVVVLDRPRGRHISRAANGETIVYAVEFGPAQQARCTLGYGNSTQAGSPHLEDQLPLMVQKTLHPVWREKKDIDANLENRESF
jgi:acyl-homoserine-lactone acylase